MVTLSIIVPIYNIEEYLERCIKSLLEQTYTEFELILVNDGSTDESGEICDYFAKRDARIKVYHQENQGQGAARNLGIEKAQGEFLGFVDGDDWVSMDMYEYLLSLVETYKSDIGEVKYQIVKKYAVIDNSKSKNKVEVLRNNNILLDYLDTGMKKRVAGYSVCNKIYRAKLFQGIKFSNLNYSEDYLVNFQIMARASSLIKSNKICYSYFQRENSTIHGRLKKKDFDLITNSSKVMVLAEDMNNEKLIKLAYDRLIRCYFSLSLKASLFGIANDVRQDDVADLNFKLKKNYLKLIQSKMPINRKLIMTILVLKNFFLKKDFPVKRN